MDLRIYAFTEDRKGSSMSKAPDLSAFPIPRKGGAKPLVEDDVGAIKPREGEGGTTELLSPIPHPAASSPPGPVADPRESRQLGRAPSAARSARPAQAPRGSNPSPPTYGQTVATTVKLDENRYLRLMEAGRPGPGHLKRRTIQDMVIEALDEWFERRQL